jgi:hypothetical protein
MQLLVVPRSIPNTFAIFFISFLNRLSAFRALFPRGHPLQAKSVPTIKKNDKKNYNPKNMFRKNKNRIIAFVPHS